MMYQCELQQGTGKTVAWIDARGAKVGASVRLLSADGEFWKVAKVYNYGLDEKTLKAKQASDRNAFASIPAR